MDIIRNAVSYLMNKSDNFCISFTPVQRTVDLYDMNDRILKVKWMTPFQVCISQTAHTYILALDYWKQPEMQQTALTWKKSGGISVGSVPAFVAAAAVLTTMADDKFTTWRMTKYEMRFEMCSHTRSRIRSTSLARATDECSRYYLPWK